MVFLCYIFYPCYILEFYKKHLNFGTVCCIYIWMREVKENMKKIIVLFVCMLLIVIAIPALGINIYSSERYMFYENEEEINSLFYEPGTWLLTTRWGQHEYYHDKTPTDSHGDHFRLGCWSVAIGQIMRFHELQSHGLVLYLYHNEDGDYVPCVNNLNAFEYDWSLMPDELNASSSDDEIDHVSQLLYDTATVIQKDWGTMGYCLIPSKRAENLTEHFEYISVQTEYVVNPPINDIIDEIDAYRPCMLYVENIAGTTGHAVALDGYEWKGNDFWVHLNFGWTGLNDNFYNYDQAIDIYDNNSLRGLMFIRLSPNKPQKPVGPSTGVPGLNYNFTTTTTVPKQEIIYYRWDFGDGTFSDWLGRYNSGETCEVSHAWKEKGIYNIRVKAKSQEGWESPWSDPIIVSMPKSREVNRPFLLFLQKNSNLFLTIQRLLIK